ncbi:hypothetical protein B4589_010265 [Halolamina sp. CBA1230]|uniref:hypothetical protein n=1 Tax=Halolamina sp. CBA1230 TaxID=1853690 RepID=UPI00117A8D2F|nr:hypothetical protein [Halolamina sp. CBA1230]QKY20744.1 hypothetical protein B4589_010265 [Halolamina sp. CBA1230]
MTDLKREPERVAQLRSYVAETLLATFLVVILAATGNVNGTHAVVVLGLIHVFCLLTLHAAERREAGEE